MIYVLPGMGADNTMYGDTWRNLPNAVFLDWPCYRGEKSISQIAKRIIGEQNISGNDILIGSSLGGMVACEIAKSQGNKFVFLIGSARCKNEITLMFRLLWRLINIAPIKVIQWFCSKSSNKVARMFSCSHPDFIRPMCKAIFTWQGADATVQTFRIHGKSDYIISSPKNPDLSLNGGHLIAMTNPKACVDFICSKL